MKKLCACLLNISEARNKVVIEKVAKAAAFNFDNTSVLNIFADEEYNRSVITVASSVEYIAQSVFGACKEAYRLIDLSLHTGGHPRLGVVDLIPIHPLSEDVSLIHCGQIAKDIASRLATEIPGTSFFFFGAADIPSNRGLVQRRKEMSWFSGEIHDHGFDIGSSPGLRYGLTGIGAIPYVMNCNVTIHTSDMKLGTYIASSLRATSKNGLPGVQSMAFNHKGNIEIACNVEAIHIPSNHCQSQQRCQELVLNKGLSKDNLVWSFGDYFHVPPSVIENHVKNIAHKNHVRVDKNIIVGFSPKEAQHTASQALLNGQKEFWRTRLDQTMM